MDRLRWIVPPLLLPSACGRGTPTAPATATAIPPLPVTPTRTPTSTPSPTPSPTLTPTLTFAQVLEILEKARPAIDQVADHSMRSLLLVRVAVLEAKTGQEAQASQTCTQAIQAAREIQDDFWHALALAGIARAQAKARQFDQALQTARGVEDTSWRVWALGEIPRAQVKAGQVEQALRMAEPIADDSPGYASFLLGIARGLLGIEIEEEE